MNKQHQKATFEGAGGEKKTYYRLGVTDGN